MHSGRWGLSRETISLLCLRHDHFSCGIFFCLIPQPINQYHNALQKAQMRLFFCLSDLYLYFSTGSNVIILCVYYSCTLIALNYKEKVITFTNWQLKKKDSGIGTRTNSSMMTYAQRSGVIDIKVNTMHIFYAHFSKINVPITLLNLIFKF